jgi:hypothetical protein
MAALVPACCERTRRRGVVRQIGATQRLSASGNAFNGGGGTNVVLIALSLAGGATVSGAASIGTGVTVLLGFDSSFGSISSSGTLNIRNYIVTVAGNFTQAAAGTLRMTATAPSAYGRLAVGGHANLGGALNVAFLGGYVPTDVALANILTANTWSGSFASTTVTLPGLKRFYLEYLESRAGLSVNLYIAGSGIFGKRG